jgi:hypothetical protein
MLTRLAILFSVCLAAAGQVTPAVNTPMAQFPGRVLLGVLKGANFNSTSDQAIPITGAGKYVITGIRVTNASASLTLAVGGFYAAASKTTALVGAGQVYTALTATSKYLDCTLAALVGTDVRTESTLYLSLTVAQGSAATADVYIFGEVLP